MRVEDLQQARAGDLPDLFMAESPVEVWMVDGRDSTCPKMASTLAWIVGSTPPASMGSSSLDMPMPLM